MPVIKAIGEAVQNTNRELWREREGDYYADSIFVTPDGGIGMNVRGFVIVKSIREWFLAMKDREATEGNPHVNSLKLKLSDSERDRIGQVLFRKMEHLDPSVDGCYEEDDWGWSRLNDHKKEFYRLCVDAVVFEMRE